MAKADYRLCDVCGGKAFYDANLNYDDPVADGGPRVNGEDLPPYARYRLDYLGDWAVICEDCAKEFKTIVVPRS